MTLIDIAGIKLAGCMTDKTFPLTTETWFGSQHSSHHHQRKPGQDKSIFRMVPADGISIHQNLSSSLPLLNSDHDFWWHKTGRPLASLLEQANYSSSAQYRYLVFYREFILSALGPSRLPTSECTWQSFMTDNGTPIELSLCWDAKGEAAVKFSIEPIGKDAGTASDPMNLKKMGEFMESMNDLPSERHSQQWFRALERGLFERQSILDSIGSIPVGSNKESHESTQDFQRIQSQYFAAVDLLADHTVVKAYLIPELESQRTGRRKFELADQAVQNIGGSIMQPWSMIKECLYSKQGSKQIPLDVEILSVDCLKPEDSRIKVYFRTRSTSYRAVKDLLLLGGALQPYISDGAMEALSQLWRRVLSISAPALDDSWETQDLPHVDHRTAGFLFYFEMRLGSSVPWPKVYLPVRHYTKNDEVIAKGIEDFMGMYQNIFGQWGENGRYSQALRNAFEVEDLSSSRGLHTYVTFAVKPSGWEIHSYFNPGWKFETY